MCTVTVIPDGDTVVLTMNRDERRSRKEGGLVVVNTLADTDHCYPLDQQGGGTWVGASEGGFAVALLNRYNAPSSTGRLSRGLLVRDAVELATFDQALTYMMRIEFKKFNPFDCILACNDGRVHLFSWDGEAFSNRTQETGSPLVLTSSSWNFEQVQAYRFAQFDTWLEEFGQAQDVDLYHLHQDTDMKKSAVFMSREPTHTKSLVQIKLNKHSTTLAYYDESAVKKNARISEFVPTADASFERDSEEEGDIGLTKLRSVAR